jgi:hypothetical protein
VALLQHRSPHRLDVGHHPRRTIRTNSLTNGSVRQRRFSLFFTSASFLGMTGVPGRLYGSFIDLNCHVQGTWVSGLSSSESAPKRIASWSIGLWYKAPMVLADCCTNTAARDNDEGPLQDCTKSHWYPVHFDLSKRINGEGSLQN